MKHSVYALIVTTK